VTATAIATETDAAITATVTEIATVTGITAADARDPGQDHVPAREIPITTVPRDAAADCPTHPQISDQVSPAEFPSPSSPVEGLVLCPG